MALMRNDGAAGRRPTVVRLEEAELFSHDAGGRNVRLITGESHGSDVLLGACWLEPGEETRAWSAERDGPSDSEVLPHGYVDEVYFVVTGEIELVWNEENRCTCVPYEAVYLPPGYRYKVRNLANVPAFFVYGVRPAIV